MSRGKRFYDEQKLNVKKILMIIAVIIIVMLFFYGIRKLLNKDNETTDSFSEISYFAVYENQKWGVTNSKGDMIINPEITSMIIVPNSKKDVFVYEYEEDGKYKTKAVNSNNEQLFTSYENVSCINNYDKEGNIWYEKNTLRVQKDGKYGLIDLSGNEILTTVYDQIDTIKGVDNSLIIKKDDKFGLSNASGNVIIEPIYTEISALTTDYTNGYIVKDNEGNYGVIGNDKTQILDCKYNNIKHVCGSGLYVVKVGDKWKVVKNNEDEGTEIKYSDVKSINNENFVVAKDNSYGIVDKSQNEKVALDYQYLEYVFSDYYIAKKDDKYGVINSSAEVLVNFDYDKIKYNKDADCLVGTKNDDNNKYLIDRNLELKQTCTSFSVNNGYIRAKIGDEYKFFNLKFEEKNNREVYPNNTLFVARNDGKFGLVNKDGKLVVSYQYEDITEQNEYGYVAVKKDGKWGVIDQYANSVVDPKYTVDKEDEIHVVGKWIQLEKGNLSCYTCE